MSALKSTVLIGADPEAFVGRGPRIWHCINTIGGTKENPLEVQDGALQEDNVLFEFNVNPSDDPKVFAERIQNVLFQGRNILMNHGLNIRDRISSHIYDDMEGFPEKAFEFGCTPDYNGFTGQVNPKPSAENQLLRTAGGHVHIGYSHLRTVTDELSRDIVCMCDYLLGLPSLLEDNDTRRRELYGAGGACRLKSYGPEYRTLSNYWIWDEASIQKIHGRAQQAYEQVGLLPQLQALIPQEEVQRVINTGAVAEAKAMLEIVRHATK